jgi:hypothetical protein
MAGHDDNVEQVYQGHDAKKRETLRRLLKGTAFVAPVVASFAIDSLTISKVHAQVANGSGFVFSDRRLKTDIVRIGSLPSGIGYYSFRYLWSPVEHVGVLAQEVLDVAPHAVAMQDNGFYAVDYGALGL